MAVLRGGDGFDHDLRRAVTQRVFRHVPVAMDTTFAKKATAKVSKSRRLQAAERRAKIENQHGGSREQVSKQVGKQISSKDPTISLYVGSIGWLATARVAPESQRCSPTRRRSAFQMPATASNCTMAVVCAQSC